MSENVVSSNASFVSPLTQAASPIQLPLYNVGDGGGDGSAGSTPSTPSVAPSPAPSGSPAVSPSATPTGTPAPAQGAAPEDRSNWIPPYRWRESQDAFRRAQGEFQQQATQWQREREQMEARVRALVGVSAPQNPEVDQIKSQFGNIFPGLSKLEDKVQALEQLLERAGDMESQNEHYWQSYGRQNVDRLFSKAAEAIGTPLSDEGKRLLHSSFVGFVQSSPENSQRYASDPSIVDDFLKLFQSSVIDPSRRQQAAGIMARAPQGLPQDSPAGVPQIPGAPKPQNLDERTALAWTAFNAAKQS